MIINYLLRIGDSHQTKQFRQRLMVGDLLHIGILRLIGFVGGLALIQHFKGDLTLDFRCRWLWDHPRGIKSLDGFQTGHD